VRGFRLFIIARGRFIRFFTFFISAFALWNLGCLLCILYDGTFRNRLFGERWRGFGRSFIFFCCEITLFFFKCLIKFGYDRRN
jgi:hypothetical protein